MGQRAVLRQRIPTNYSSVESRSKKTNLESKLGSTLQYRALDVDLGRFPKPQHGRCEDFLPRTVMDKVDPYD